jgi:uncharacterized HhH-GPD family protein
VAAARPGVPGRRCGVGLRLAQNPQADSLLDRDPLALLIGMLLDQQVPMERAFGAPYLLAQRLGRDRLDVDQLARYDLDSLVGLFVGPPALHRFPGAMARRVRELCRHLQDRYGGDTAALWRDAGTGAELLRRVEALPGFGRQKARIFVALLGKQYGVTPPGWREAAGPYGEEGTRRSVADVVDEATLAEVRAFKRMSRKAGGATS